MCIWVVILLYGYIIFNNMIVIYFLTSGKSVHLIKLESWSGQALTIHNCRIRNGVTMNTAIVMCARNQ